VKAIRTRLGMTQARFSNTFGFSLDAIEHWEGGSRIPEAPARTLLTVIDKNPAAVLTALNPARFAATAGSSNPPLSARGLTQSVRLRVVSNGRLIPRKVGREPRGEVLPVGSRSPIPLPSASYPPS
jgi:hypothetical protein